MFLIGFIFVVWTAIAFVAIMICANTDVALLEDDEAYWQSVDEHEAQLEYARG